MRYEFNPGNFGEVFGHIKGTTEALKAESVQRAIGEAFLRFTMERGFEEFDLLARAQASRDRTGRGYLRYAYAGGDPLNIGDEGKRLFEAAPVQKTGAGYSITYNTLEDYEEAFSPTLGEPVNGYVFRDRMQAAMEGRSGTRYKKKGGYAVSGFMGEDVKYRRSFSFDFETQLRGWGDFDAVLDDMIVAAANGPASQRVNVGVKSAITKAYNRKVGKSGATGFSRTVMDGYSASYAAAQNLLDRFMVEEMAKVIAEAE